MLQYSVWCEDKVYDEEPEQTKRTAVFTYLRDAIDYAASLARAGVRCVLTGPYALATEYTQAAEEQGYTIRDARGRK